MLRATSLAAVAGAIAGLAIVACTDGAQKSITAPASSPRNLTTQSGGLGNAASVSVCVDISSPAGTYKFTNSGFLGYFAVGVGGWLDGANGGNGATTLTVPVATEYAVAPGTCTPVMTRGTPDSFYPVFPDTWSGVTMTATTIPATAVYDHTDCLLDQGVKNPAPNSGPPNFLGDCGTGNNPTRAYMNIQHGTKVTFFFKDAPVAPADCVLGYPSNPPSPRGSVVFNESGALSAYGRGGDEIRLWYTDEHAMTLGVRQVVAKNPNSTTNYGLSPTPATPGSAIPPIIANQILAGTQRGTDPVDRPLWPSAFITDLGTVFSATNRSGDWQYNGTAVAPNAVYGTWKGAVATVTVSTGARTVTPDGDPAKNHTNLGGGGATAVPAGAPDLGYSAEVVWSIASLGLDPTHYYRVQMMVHDGDQNKGGGDVGQACITIGPGYTTTFTKLNPQS